MATVDHPSHEPCNGVSSGSSVVPRPALSKRITTGRSGSLKQSKGQVSDSGVMGYNGAAALDVSTFASL